MPTIALALATEATEVRVVVPTVEVAAEIKEQEKQRVLGFVPNFYVSYVSDAAPLTAKQKFELAWKTTIDPVSFALTGVIAGIEQSQDALKDTGRVRRDMRSGLARRMRTEQRTFIGGAILPTLFKQDPRYFYKGTGRCAGAVCAGERGDLQGRQRAAGVRLFGVRWAVSGGISNSYYAKDRKGRN